MANNTLTLTIPETWVDLTVSVPLIENDSYVFQNVGAGLLYIVESDLVPNADDVGITLPQYKYIILSQSALTTKFWARSGNSQTGKAILSLGS